MTTPYAIVDPETSFLAGLTTEVKSIAASLRVTATVLSSPEHTVDGNATYDVVHTVGRADHELTEKDRVISNSCGTDLDDGDELPSTLWTVLKLDWRVHAQV